MIDFELEPDREFVLAFSYGRYDKGEVVHRVKYYEGLLRLVVKSTGEELVGRYYDFSLSENTPENKKIQDEIDDCRDTHDKRIRDLYLKLTGSMGDLLQELKRKKEEQAREEAKGCFTARVAVLLTKRSSLESTHEAVADLVMEAYDQGVKDLRDGTLAY